MSPEVPHLIAMQPDKNTIRGLLRNSVFSYRPNLRCDLGTWAQESLQAVVLAARAARHVVSKALTSNVDDELMLLSG